MKENIVIDGKYYHLIQGDNGDTIFITKFYDKPIDTLCVTETEVLYIPSKDWIKMDRKSARQFLEMAKAVDYDLSKYDESLYLALCEPAKFDADDNLLKELKAAIDFKDYLF